METHAVVLQTRLGKLRGQSKKSQFSGNTYYGFQGIPYGKPPLGKLRFKAPQPFGGWEGVRDALKDGSDPKQAVMMPKPGMDTNQVAEGDEDCLYLNVYINKLPQDGNPKKPVMFNIHGGGFVGGSGGVLSLGPDLQLEGDVVFVSFNYRVGAFGFLSLESKEAPGNAGLKDQVLALRWVKDNIDSFGGDPDNITILGISAGGASVHYQLLSPLSKGLFHKAIMQSGFALNPWALQKEPRTNATTLAMQMGYSSENDDDLLKFLQSVPADDIIVATKALGRSKDFLETVNLKFVPCVEIPGPDAFLAEAPFSIMERGQFHQIPVILGGAVNEGSVIMFYGGLGEKQIESINKAPEQLVPSFLQLEDGSVEKKEAQKAIWNFYSKDSSLSWDNIYKYLMYTSDILFNIGMEATRQCLLDKSSSPVYSYLMTNHSRCICTKLKFMFGLPPEHIPKVITEDTCHGADCQFQYILNLMHLEITPEDKIMIKKHITAWTNFASTGNPNGRELDTVWDIDSTKQPCYIDIGLSWQMKEGIPFADRMDFWNKLRSKYCKT